jgi:hypothetical protein
MERAPAPSDVRAVSAELPGLSPTYLEERRASRTLGVITFDGSARDHSTKTPGETNGAVVRVAPRVAIARNAGVEASGLRPGVVPPPHPQRAAPAGSTESGNPPESPPR